MDIMILPFCCKSPLIIAHTECSLTEITISPIFPQVDQFHYQSGCSWKQTCEFMQTAENIWKYVTRQVSGKIPLIKSHFLVQKDKPDSRKSAYKT